MNTKAEDVTEILPVTLPNVELEDYQVSPQGDEEYLDWCHDVASLRSEAKRFREDYSRVCVDLAETFSAAMGDPEPQKYLHSGYTIADVVQDERRNLLEIHAAQHALITNGGKQRAELAEACAAWQAKYQEAASKASEAEYAQQDYAKLESFLLDSFPAAPSIYPGESPADVAIRLLTVGKGLVEAMLPIVTDHIINPIISVAKREGLVK